ncbi:MAG TPA: feruloyl-CoA synthase [Alphaproteobacteria bacterium]|nr:feruloyl-CoA synthase [Alphaproteobacteria bacterium]
MTNWGKFAVPKIALERRADGAIVIRPTDPLDDYPPRMGDVFLRQARAIPDRLYMAGRDTAGGWRKLTYGDMGVAARAIGQALLDRKLGPERPVLIVAENGIDHALMAIGGLIAGVPFAPVSAAYARPGQGFTKLKYILDLVRPGLIFVDTWARYAGARSALDAAGCEVVVAGELPDEADVTPFAALTAAVPTAAVEAAANAVGPETIAKILFTSGSTDLPKGVINTHRMLCANQVQIGFSWPFLRQTPPVLCDWLPWSHTFAGNHNFHLVPWHGGTYYLDEGKPAPGLIDRTVANLREVSPTIYLNVPRGYALLLDHLERDAALCERFFRRLEFVFYAGAAMADSLQGRLRRLAEQVTGEPLPLVCAWGATETAPQATGLNYPNSHPTCIGLPSPGVEIKLAPVGDKYEIRVRGPNVTPGYWRRPDATAAAFDDEGFYRSGDAAKFCDPARPEKGLLFDGRIAENFKLSTGTWVHVGAVRLAAIAACAPVIEDCVITGHDRDEIGALVFPSIAGCRALCPDLAPDAPVQALIAAPAVREALARGLRRLKAESTGSSMHIERALLVAELPTIDSNEITDKGYINQRAVLKNRAALVEQLHADAPGAAVVRLAGELIPS